MTRDNTNNADRATSGAWQPQPFAQGSEEYARLQLEQIGALRLRKKPVESWQKTPDYALVAGDTIVAVAEVKLFEQTPRTSGNGWESAPGGGLTRPDNAPARIATRIHDAVKQLRAYPEPKVLILVNDEPFMNVGDLREALAGYLDYGNDETGYIRNVASSRRAAVMRIQEEKFIVDLFVWLDRYTRRQLPARPEGPFFTFGSEAGYELARAYFGAPEVPRGS